MSELFNVILISVIVVIIAECIYAYVRYKYMKGKSYTLYNKYRNILTELPFGVILFDGEGKLIKVNDFSKDILGFPTIKEIELGFNLFDASFFTQADKNAILSGNFIPVDRIYTYDNQLESSYVESKVEERYIHCVVEEVRNDKGTIENYILILIDNTYKKKQEIKNTDLTNLLDSLLSHIPVPLSIKEVGEKIRYIYWNKAAEEMGGVPEHEVLGKTDVEIFGDEQGKRFAQLDEELLSDGGTKTYYDNLVVRNDGSSLRTNVITALVKRNDSLPYILTTRWDVTERLNMLHQFEVNNHRLSMVLEAGGILPWTWDVKKDEFILDYNYSADEESLVAEYLRKSNNLASVLQTIHPDDVESFQSKLMDLCMGVVEKIRLELRVLSHTGQYIWYGIYAIADRNPKAPLFIIGTAINMNKRKWTEHKLLEAKEKAEEASRLKTSFLSTVSHEIRTPLNAIVGFSGLLAITENQEEKNQYLEIVDKNKDLLLQLVNDILDLSKIEAGILELNYSFFDINALIDETYQIFKMKHTNPDVELILECKQEECFVVSDKIRVAQVINNFITNAVKFTQKGSIKMGYKITDGDLYLYVTDTGCGIPESKIDTIYERFVKLNEYSQGTGLGLSICKVIIHKLGGRIGVESQEGKGSTFWFILPYHAEDMNAILPR